ncbi:DUF4174 domain-containing protein [Rhizobium lentis]|uniref:DUF4174 domain-containing protein n=1 Tax=Rhizobium lentis TaxID=1138194 RepID=UPI001C828B3D|nr:DUF4174 domain-containing protein [Rhizobium lentis]MBX4954813.1 DUF4174 domain-containing protein [Rhizobium lentis]MBX4976477.1 DUF4174 domain-containing protein [Rhizobium lentis]MBX4985680.1 DUF4174 domain-containing protein [Rhizobium lentis]MBX5004124.1 DUF4174 domain-containing protein [Rhizobium lentis]MBX5028156.1 DUF4174 domain-containing protein [Rhizobium lentis]
MSKTLLYGATKIDETNSAYAPIESLAAFQWRNRVFVIFADRDNSRAARQENQLLADRQALDERDLVVLKISGAGVRPLFGAADGLDGEAIRRDLEALEIGEFAAFLIGKDGTVKLKVSEPITNGELFAIIDSMPQRAAETLRADQ